MFARFLLLISVMFGLAAGPAGARELRHLAAELQCGCCVETVESCCVSAPAENSRPLPIRGVASSHDLKLAIAPLLVWLGSVEFPAAIEHGDREVNDAGRFATVPLIDRICIRLI